jgi:ABC-type amino acid transport substrate-binding protein
MKKGLPRISLVIILLSCWVCASAIGADIELAKKSTLETILKRGALWVGFDSGYMPFEMMNQKGRYVGFDIDMAKEMAMGVKFVPINTAWAVRKTDPDFLNWLNNFLRQIKNDGQYDKIYNKWIKSTDWIKNVQRLD